ncbi:hypothetical protein ES705_43549 [subsurface metagenome]
MPGHNAALINLDLSCNRLLLGACRSDGAGDGNGCAWSDFRWSDSWFSKVKINYLFRWSTYIIDIVPLTFLD